MSDNYEKIVRENLGKLFNDLPGDLERNLPAIREKNGFTLEAFGETCGLAPEGITLNGAEEWGVLGILISLYALHTKSDPLILEPLKAFKEFKNSMPYAGAFTTHTERILTPHVEKIEAARDRIMERFRGHDAASSGGGDFSFVLRPLPKVHLCYIFYRADDEFPASATCLFSNNAERFLTVDALADVGEYTSRKIIDLVS